MKNKRIFKTLSALCAALVLMGGFLSPLLLKVRSSPRRRMPPTIPMWWKKLRTVLP